MRCSRLSTDALSAHWAVSVSPPARDGSLSAPVAEMAPAPRSEPSTESASKPTWREFTQPRAKVASMLLRFSFARCGGRVKIEHSPFSAARSAGRISRKKQQWAWIMLSKKRSRSIVVGGEEYRWSIADDGIYGTLAIQHADANGQRLEVIVQFIDDGCAESGVSTRSGLIRAVTPVRIEKIIRDGLTIGWLPQRRFPPLEVTLNALDRLEVRRGLVF